MYLECEDGEGGPKEFASGWCKSQEEEAKGQKHGGTLGNANKRKINALSLIRNIAIFHRCQWNKGISNIALLTGFFIIETLASSCAPQLLIHQARLASDMLTASDWERAFQVAGQTF